MRNRDLPGQIWLLAFMDKFMIFDVMWKTDIWNKWDAMRFCKRDAVELAILFVINFLFRHISRWLCDIDTNKSFKSAKKKNWDPAVHSESWTYDRSGTVLNSDSCIERLETCWTYWWEIKPEIQINLQLIGIH